MSRFRIVFVVVVSSSLLCVPAFGQVCGDGTLDFGEQCDFADTNSGVDECDGCALDCTITEECGLGPCADGIDNDGDGFTDAEDDECGTLPVMQRLAITGTEPVRQSVRLRREARVDTEPGTVPGDGAPFPFGDSKAVVCGESADIRDDVRLEGDLVSVGTARFVHKAPAGIAGLFVSSTGGLPEMTRGLPTVGSTLGVCSVGGNDCLSGLDCVGRRELCVGREDLGVANAAVDLDGSGAGLESLDLCRAGLAEVAVLASQIEAIAEVLAPAQDELRLKFGADETVPLQPGANVLRYDNVRMGYRSTLSFDGPPDASAIIIVDRRLSLGSRARIQLTGGIEPSRVLWLFQGVRPPFVNVSARSSLVGTILAPGKQVRLGREAVVTGAIHAKTVTLGRAAQVIHQPFTGLFPANLTLAALASPDPVAAGGTLAYDLTVTNGTAATAPATVITLDLDPGTTFSSAVPSQGSCSHDGSPAGGQVVCNLGMLADEAGAPANGATVALQVSVDAGVSGLLSATAVAGASEPDLDPSDNTVLVETTVQ